MDAGVFECSREDLADNKSFQGETQKLIQPASLEDPKLQKLKEALVDWINCTLKPEHIVVQRLEEDLYDGLVLHHLLSVLAGVRVSVEEIALTSAAQIKKLEAILEELNQKLGLQESQIKWNVKLIHNKDMLATIHLLVAMVRCFQPELHLPPNVKVEVVNVEVSRSGITSDVQTEVLTEERDAASDSLSGDEAAFQSRRILHSGWTGPLTTDCTSNCLTHFFIIIQAILQFVNRNLSSVGLQVVDLDKQFADGVILLLLIGQLEGFFIPLHDFTLTPVNSNEMLNNVSLALNLLGDTGLQVSKVDPQDIVSQDATATLKVLYALFRKHK
ncbi:gamma-parvin [Antennarius striatus]|uniref:gamma-parvin n=1 Tax=Antennarius striatus TaxID=241820 RepID=UPI0035AF9692